MEKYEIMYILNATLEEGARKAEIEKLHGILTAQKATVNDVKEWGVKAFASPIHNLTKGYYVVINVTADVAALKEFDRLVKLDSNVIRHLVTVAHKTAKK